MNASDLPDGKPHADPPADRLEPAPGVEPLWRLLSKEGRLVVRPGACDRVAAETCRDALATLAAELAIPVEVTAEDGGARTITVQAAAGTSALDLLRLALRSMAQFLPQKESYATA